MPPLSCLATILAVVLVLDGPQAKPDFSGTWFISQSTVVGGRGADSGQAPVTTAVTTVSGAAFNCGRTCVIAHDGTSLRVSEALLGSDKATAPTVEFGLNGRETSILDSFNPKRHIKAIAKWTGRGIEVISWSGPSVFTQTLSREDGHLIVVSSFSRDPDRPLRLRYRKK